ncbi:antibiotic biosynthesis monooxygenase family protein [Actinomadura flavalba]|uniref:antibiotic biosynthesis monooxygenase family protein n=1 Tax=Actinomadura flavalba TaxID=1120938 RepID=UPI000361406B|nr:antibiotic biosynthesis monooxygenase [Actinomadura flavalba]
MIAVTRYRVPQQRDEDFAAGMRAVLDLLAGSPGHLTGRLARNMDEPDLWTLVTEWEGAGYYRRALGATDVRVRFLPLAAFAVDEPGAYEVVAFS